MSSPSTSRGSRRRTLAGGALAVLALAAPVGIAPTASAASRASTIQCETLRQYVSTAQSLSVRTQPTESGDVRGYLPEGGKFNFRSSSNDGAWYYGYADGIGFGFVLARYLQFSREITSC